MSDEADATGLLYYTIARLERALGRAAENVAIEHGLSEPQLLAGLVLAEGTPISNAQLARRTFVSSQASHELTSNLVRRGLVQREAHATNKRVRLLSLTEEGWKLIASCRESLIAIEEQATETLAPNTREDLIDLLISTAATLKGGYFGDEEAESAALELKARFWDKGK